MHKKTLAPQIGFAEKQQYKLTASEIRPWSSERNYFRNGRDEGR